MYKKFLIDKLKKNEIEVVYIIKPLWAGNDIIEKGLDDTINWFKENNKYFKHDIYHV